MALKSEIYQNKVNVRENMDVVSPHDTDSRKFHI